MTTSLHASRPLPDPLALLASLRRPVARSVRALVLAVALAAPLAAAPVAEAQFARALPGPVSATDYARMLDAAGVPKEVRDLALPLHEGYFAQFRAFEEREVEPAIDRSPLSGIGSPRTVESAKAERDMRRRLLQRAKQLDDQLVTDVEALLPAADQPAAQALREALGRRRASAVIPLSLTGMRPNTFDLAASPALAGIDGATRARIAPILAAYGSELARSLDRAAESALEMPVLAAELREKRQLPEAPQPKAPEGAEGGAVAQDASEWVNALLAIEQEAGAETRANLQRIRTLHRETLRRLEPELPPATARALLSELVRGSYPMLRPRNAFDEAVGIAENMRAKGLLDDARWAAAGEVMSAHAAASRPMLDELMDLADRSSATFGDGSGLMVIAGTTGEEPIAGDSRSKAVAADLDALATRDAASLRGALGLEVVEDRREERRPNRGQIAGNIGEAIQGGTIEVAVDAQAVVMGSGGEMLAISGDDMADSGMLFLGGEAFGGGPRVVRPFTGAELDRLAGISGLDGPQRPAFDEIAARCAEARSAAEAEAKPDASKAMVSEDGSYTITFAIGGEGEIGSTAARDQVKLAAAVETAEESMFDALKAAASEERGDAVEAARRMRARERLALGENGMQSADLVAIVDGAGIADAARARIEPVIAEWDGGSVGALRAMRTELATLAERRQELMERMTRNLVSSEPSGDAEAGAVGGAVNIATSVEVDAEAARELGELQRTERATRARVADANKRAFDAALAALDGDELSQRLVRRAFLRASNPTIYKLPRDLSPFFTKAEALVASAEGDAAIAALRQTWIEERESRCESFLEERDAAQATGGAPGIIDDPNEAIRQMQASMRERKRLREDLDQIESTIFRGLREIVERDAGETGIKELGELPAKKRAAPMIQF